MRTVTFENYKIKLAQLRLAERFLKAGKFENFEDYVEVNNFKQDLEIELDEYEVIRAGGCFMDKEELKAKAELRGKVAMKKAAILELLDDMIDDAIGDNPDKNRLTFTYYLESIKTELKLLTRLLKERV